MHFVSSKHTLPELMNESSSNTMWLTILTFCELLKCLKEAVSDLKDALCFFQVYLAGIVDESSYRSQYNMFDISYGFVDLNSQNCRFSDVLRLFKIPCIVSMLILWRCIIFCTRFLLPHFSKGSRNCSKTVMNIIKEKPQRILTFLQ